MAIAVPTDNKGIVGAVVSAIDAIDKACGELKAASSEAPYFNPAGHGTAGSAHVVSAGAMKIADDKIRAATTSLKNAVAATYGRSAGDPNWNRPLDFPPATAAVVAPRPMFGATAAKPLVATKSTFGQVGPKPLPAAKPVAPAKKAIWPFRK
jgi:hypothetical protein